MRSRPDDASSCIASGARDERTRKGANALPPLRVHHLLYFLAAAAVAAAIHRGLPNSSSRLTLLGEVAEMSHWLGAALGASMWLLGLAWSRRSLAFFRQPGPWLVAAVLVETAFFSRFATACQRLAAGGGAAAPDLFASSDAPRWLLMATAFLVGGVALLPSRITTFGPVWRVLLALTAIQLIACAMIDPGVDSIGRWHTWRLASWPARSRGAVALAVAAMLHDATRRRRRHWSHALCTALWMAATLGHRL